METDAVKAEMLATADRLDGLDAESRRLHAVVKAAKARAAALEPGPPAWLRTSPYSPRSLCCRHSSSFGFLCALGGRPHTSYPHAVCLWGLFCSSLLCTCSQRQFRLNRSAFGLRACCRAGSLRSAHHCYSYYLRPSPLGRGRAHAPRVMAPNPSIERTSPGRLRLPTAAAHVER